MARPRVLPSVDRALDGQLAKEWRKQLDTNVTYESFARWLANEHDLHVTGNTVRTWVLDEKLPIVERAAS